MIDGDLFRKTMRQWAAGVTVMTVGEHDQVHGMTANSFTSVSCAPPLVLFCIGRNNDTRQMLKIGTTIGVNLLSESQVGLSTRFATKNGDRNRFDDLKWFKGPHGTTLFSDCAAVMEVEVSSFYEEGDHTIFIGKILWAEPDVSKRPLVYSQGGYVRVDPIPKDLISVMG